MISADDARKMADEYREKTQSKQFEDIMVAINSNAKYGNYTARITDEPNAYSRLELTRLGFCVAKETHTAIDNFPRVIYIISW